MWRVVFSKQAAKDAKKLSASGLKAKAQSLIEVLTEDPFAMPPRYECLVGDLAGMYSRRINRGRGSGSHAETNRPQCGRRAYSGFIFVKNHDRRPHGIDAAHPHGT